MSPFRISDKVLEVDTSSPTGMHEMAVLLSEHFRIVPTTSTPTSRRPDQDASKNPGGLLGKEWPTKSSRDAAVLRGWFIDAIPSHTTGALTLGAPLAPPEWYRTVEPSTVGMALHVGSEFVVVDIDYPDKVPADMWEYLNTAPFQSSSTIDGRRGHYFFRVRDGYYFGQTSAIVGRDGMGSPGEIRHGNAIVVSSPTEHPKAALGRRYEWKRTGEIPVMPEEVAEWLQSEQRSSTWNGSNLTVTEASLNDIETFRENFTDATHPQLLDQHLAFMADQADKLGLHSSTLGPLIDLMQYAMCGLVSAADAIDGAARQFVTMRIDPHRGDGSWVPQVSSLEDAQNEFVDLLKWACGRVAAKLRVDAASVQYETYQNAAYWYSAAVPSMEVPAGYIEMPPGSRGEYRDLYHPSETVTESGLPLVEDEHVPLAVACAERLSGRYQWVMSDGDREGDWYVFDESRGVWARGGLRVGVSKAVQQVLTDEIAAYAVLDTESIMRGKSERRKIMADQLVKKHGRSHTLWALTSKSSKHMPEINHVVEALKTVPIMWSKVEEFDRTESRVALANGVLDVKTGHFEATAAEHKVTKRAPVAYDPAATCPKFQQFLLDCVVKGGDYATAAEVAGTIQRYFGAALLGDWGSDNFLVAHGPAGSGKSTVFEDVLRTLLGEDSGYWSMITPQVFTRGISEAGRKFELASVAGARFLTCNEAFDGSSGIEGGFLKAFTDGSRQRAAFKGRDNFLMTPGRVVFMSNELPKLSNVDAGISRRAIFIEFPHGHDKSNPMLPDPDEKLFTRDLLPEMPGILNWMIEGAKAYLIRGIDAPASVFGETRESLADSSPMGMFLRHFRPVTEDDPSAWRDGTNALSIKDLQDLYRDWLAMEGITHSGGTLTARMMATAIKTTYGTVQIFPDRREHFYTDDGADRRKHVAVRGLMPNAEYSAFLVEAGTPQGMGLAATRHRIGLGDVEDWRRRQLGASRVTAGSPVVPPP